jgi:TPR repeat protein
MIPNLFLFLLLFGFSSHVFSFDLTEKKILAIKGDKLAQFHLGLFYQKGEKKDLLEAYYWMKMAAMENHLVACRYIGRAYLYGKGTSINMEKAKEWLLTSAKQGDSLSMVDLGYCLELENNWIESAAWYKTAHQFGHTNALKFLKNVSQNLNDSQSGDFDIIIVQIQSSISSEEKSGTVNKPNLQNLIKRVELKNGYSYWGQIKNDLPHGYGKKKLAQVTTYQGEFVMGIEHGYGTSFGSDGKISFQGQWRRGTPLLSKKETLKDLTNY